ncbi:MAG: hypothetical protein IAF94_09735, partial [Pirellulaceae bacterium]|nr:hypothetical protein [Pirellulaceae bacterium]
MRFRWFDSLYVQAGTIAVACVSVIVLAMLLIGDIAGSTRHALTEESRQQCLAAAGELKRQYDERVAYGEPLPSASGRELSLRGLAETVLRSYDGVSGGFYDAGSVVGLTLAGESSRDLGGDLRTLSAAVSISNRPQASARFVGPDAVIAALVPVRPGFSAWATKRLAGVSNPILNRRRSWMAALVAAALTGILGVAAITLHLRRGVTGIKTTLRRLGDELDYRPPPQRGDFGEIAAALAQMADRRSTLE